MQTDHSLRLNSDTIQRMSQMSPEGCQHLRKVARQQDANQSHTKFHIAQAEADMREVKERHAAAEKVKGKATE